VSSHYQVIIVGGGPVGSALAVDLGLRGISCALVEARTGLSRIPKGQNLTQRTLEHFYFWGVVDQLRAARVMPRGYPIGEVTAYGNLMSRYWHAPAGRELIRPYFFQDNDRMPQYQMEAVLREKMASLPNVETRFGWTAGPIEQDDRCVRVGIAAEGGAKDTLEADYLVGCDGGHSNIRSQLGVERGGTDFDQLMVLVVFRSRELHEGLKRFPERSTYRVMHPDQKGYWQFFGRIDVGEGWFFHAPVPADTTKENFDFLGLVQKAAGFEFSCEFEHVGFWDLRTAVAQDYQVGRVFIAGDAAHSHPPYGGFGLNNGLEDAVNLGWKLAANLNGWGGQALLRSYDEERRPVFRDIAEDFIAARIKADAEFLARYDPERDHAEFERAWNARESDVGNRFQACETSYEGSPVVHGPPGGYCGAHGAHMFKARVGHHLAPQTLSSGKNVFEELGRGFALLAFDADHATAEAFERAARKYRIPFKVVCDSYGEGRKAYEVKLILVRPDQFVAWSGDRCPEDVDALMAKVIGRA
jgi:2-polyprenyl-6-methoxyphenol hydroxylase-like FAD-dependent oxidoreductase